MSALLAAAWGRSREAVDTFAGVKHAAPALGVPVGVGPHSATILVTWVLNQLFWVAVAVAVAIYLASTKPDEASFRSHLTELTFVRHLRTLKDDPPPESTQPFRFANHFAVSVRTPALAYHSWFVFAWALTAAPVPPPFLSDPARGASACAPPARANAARDILHLGCMGHWIYFPVPEWQWLSALCRAACLVRALALAVVYLPSRVLRRKGGAGADDDRPGVLDLRIVQVSDDASPARSQVNLKLLRSDSSLDLDTLPLHAHAHAVAFPADSRRGSIANHVVAAAPPSPPLAEADLPPSPALLALKTELAAAQAQLDELVAQLASHDHAVAAAHGVLQAQLDEVRQRRKEDDAERQELKTRTKSLEEQKRQAEAGRREAEKRLRAFETTRDGLKAKIAAARGEVEDLRSNMDVSERTVRIVQDEGRRRVHETAEGVEAKRAELEAAETEVAAIEAGNDDLARRVAEAEERLSQAVSNARLAPEEEMMFMAAAYEAAASEGYLRQTQQQHAADSQWASQAAAYMAEAGMPYVDPATYSARPAHAQNYGHLVARHPNSASHRSLVGLGGAGSGAAADKKLDVHGYEDFGPGASRSLAAPRPATPPHAHTDDDEPGSPNGPMSASFTATLLPQGLFRSLEGDAASIVGDGASDVAPDDDDDDDEDDGHSPANGDSPAAHALKGPLVITTSPGSASVKHAAGGAASPAHSGSDISTDERASSRFALAHTPPYPLAPSTLPGLPALPSRRWVSGAGAASAPAASTDHLHADAHALAPAHAHANPFALFHAANTSSDSLNLAYESSPFAPSDSEKRALNWAPLAKYKWAARARADGGLGELADSLKRDLGAGPAQNGTAHVHALVNSTGTGGTGTGGGSGNGYVGMGLPGGLTPEQLFNRAPPAFGAPAQARVASIDLAPGGSWLSSRHFKDDDVVAAGGAGAGAASGAGSLQALGNGAPGSAAGLLGSSSPGDGDADEKDRRPFRFFSLRKPSGATW
ncbi:hypothetical protein Q5752_006881 [Cryptotrichosporon argae]